MSYYSKEREKEKDLQYKIMDAERMGKKDVAEYLYNEWLEKYSHSTIKDYEK